jgi:hypothetical protein
VTFIQWSPQIYKTWKLKVRRACVPSVLCFSWCPPSLIDTLIPIPRVLRVWLASRSGHLQAVGAFSILTLSIQAPGTMVVVYFLLFVSGEDVRRAFSCSVHCVMPASPV